MTSNPSWHAEAKRLYAEGVTLSAIAQKVGRSKSVVRFALDINNEREKHKQRIAERRKRERASLRATRIRVTRAKTTADISEQRAVERAYGDRPDQDMRRAPTLPKISLPAIDEPVLIRFVPKVTVKPEPEGVERIRQIHRRMIRMGKIAAPDLVSAFNA